MSFWTPILLTIAQIEITFLIFIILMKLLQAKLDRQSCLILLGLSIAIGYFLFPFVLVLVTCLALALIVKVWKGKRRERRFVPPEDFGGIEDERE